MRNKCVRFHRIVIKYLTAEMRKIPHLRQHYFVKYNFIFKLKIITNLYRKCLFQILSVNAKLPLLLRTIGTVYDFKTYVDFTLK